MDREYMAPYGTLRVGHSNWRWALADCPVVKTNEKLLGFAMRTSGYIPAIFVEPSKSVVVDVIDITDLPRDMLQRIDSMEFGCGYERRQVMTDSGYLAWAYVMPQELGQYWNNEIQGGDWGAFIGERT